MEGCFLFAAVTLSVMAQGKRAKTADQSAERYAKREGKKARKANQTANWWTLRTDWGTLAVNRHMALETSGLLRLLLACDHLHCQKRPLGSRGAAAGQAGGLRLHPGSRFGFSAARWRKRWGGRSRGGGWEMGLAPCCFSRVCGCVALSAAKQSHLCQEDVNIYKQTGGGKEGISLFAVYTKSWFFSVPSYVAFPISTLAL